MLNTTLQRSNEFLKSPFQQGTGQLIQTELGNNLQSPY